MGELPLFKNHHLIEEREEMKLVKSGEDATIGKLFQQVLIDLLLIGAVHATGRFV